MMDDAEAIPMQAIARDVLREKYLRGGETAIADVHERVATTLATVEAVEKRGFYRELFLRALGQGFIPGGRIDANVGTGRQSTWLNCFVQPIGDAIAAHSEAAPAIYTALAEAAETTRRGGGVGYNFSALRPRGAMVSGIESRASGPLSYMDIFERSCVALETADARRGAQMAVLNIEHPDIYQFVDAKRERGRFSSFNLSVGVGDAFMQLLASDGDFDLVHKAAPGPEQIAAGALQRGDGLWIYRRVKARELWSRIMRAAYDCAEPGVLFLDRINRENNLAYCENIEATNPCGEQPLPAYGSCCLGSLNLTRFVDHPFTPQAHFNRERMIAAIKPAVRMLDNVIDATPWPLPAQCASAQSTRRIGLGITGLADALIMLGQRYDSAQARQLAALIGETLRDTAYAQSIELAAERGAFPLFRAQQYLNAPFVARLPQALRRRIQRHGIRNSHLLSIAPAGTISLAFADNVSSGIEPAFSWSYYRYKKLSQGGSRRYLVEDYAYRYFRRQVSATATLPAQFVDAWQIDPFDHLDMAVALAPFIDAGISKTINVSQNYPFDRFQNLYLEAWRKGLKGITVYRPNAITGAVLTRSTRDRSVSACDGCRI